MSSREEKAPLPFAHTLHIWLRGALAVCLLAYVGARAFLVPFTHDESYSFLHYAGKSFWTILTSAGSSRSNNHLLNSLLTRLAMLVFGTSEWALRLPNVLAFVAFAVVSFVIMRRVSSGHVGTCGFVLLTTNPYLLELFSMERGYGLGLAFLAACLLFLLRAHEGSNPAREETLTTVCAALAVLSNFTFLLVFGAVVLLVIVRRPPRRLADSAPWAIPTVLLAGAVAAPLLTLKRSGELYFGGRSGFFQDTVRSLIQLTLPESGAAHSITQALEIAVVTAFVCGLAVLLFAPAASVGRRLVGVALPVALLAGLASVAQHALLGTPYLFGRTGIFFLPLLALIATGTIDAIASSKHGAVRIAGSIFAFVLTSGALVNLAFAGNLDHSVVFRFDADTKRMLGDLSIVREGSTDRASFCAEGVLEPSMNFYRVTSRLGWLDPVPREKDSGYCNFLFIQPGDLDLGIGNDLLLVKRYPLSGNLLVRNVHPQDPIRRAHEDANLIGSLDGPEENKLVRGTLSVRG